MEVAKPHKFIRFGAMHVTKPHKFIRFGDIYVTKLLEIYKIWGHGGHQRKGGRETGPEDRRPQRRPEKPDRQTSSVVMFAQASDDSTSQVSESARPS